MSVSNGQTANQTTFNGAFLSRTTDSDTTAVIGLKNVSDVNSGALITNTQRLVNEVRDATGVAGEGDSARKNYSSNNVVTNGDDRKVAIGKLDAKFHETSGHTHTGVAGDAPQISIDDLLDTPKFPSWTKYTVSHTALQFAGLTNDIEVFLLGNKQIIHQIVIKQAASFTGGAIASYTLSVGISSDLTKYASAFDVFQSPGDTIFEQSIDAGLENFGSNTSIRLAAISTGANLDQSTTGSVEIYVLKSTLP